MVKRFEHLPRSWDVAPLERVEGDGMRLYRTPSGELYPSVTTVLSHAVDHPELDAWRARVGDAEADEVTARAANRGTLVHGVAEDYLNNRLDPKSVNPMVLQDFLPIKGVLDEHVDRILCTEVRMYSDRLRTAGTGDLFAHYDGVLSYIDFKTARRDKEESDIESYFIQESAYSFMMFERYGVLVEDVITVMMRDGDSRSRVFRKKAVDYLPRFLELRERFKERTGI